MNQDIWDEFEKIAVAQGLIALSEDDYSKPLPKRYDSLSDDAIRLLYNIEPEPEKDKTIIEVAHPETFTVGTAYDAMNSVVENEHQHQDMMAYIALKVPNGHLTQRRYVAAKQELLNSLIRSAFTLDNKDEEGLMVLADSCAKRLDERSEQITKEGIAPLAVAGVASAAALLGIAYYFIWGAPTAQNVYTNAQRVLDALEPLSDQPYADPIKKDMTTVMSMAEQLHAMRTQLATVHSVDDVVNAAQQASENAKIEEAKTKRDAYVAQLRKIYAALPEWVRAIRSAHVNQTSTNDFFAKLQEIGSIFTEGGADEKLVHELIGKSDWFAKIKQYIPGTQDHYAPGQDNSKEAVHGGLKEAIENEISVMKQSFNKAQEQVPEIQNSLDIAAQKTKPSTPDDAKNMLVKDTVDNFT
jgi:hypothetical protein